MGRNKIHTGPVRTWNFICPVDYLDKLDELRDEGKISGKAQAMRQALMEYLIRYGKISLPELYFNEIETLIEEGQFPSTMSFVTYAIDQTLTRIKKRNKK